MFMNFPTGSLIGKEVLKDYSGLFRDGIYGYELSILIDITATFFIIFVYIYNRQIKNNY